MAHLSAVRGPARCRCGGVVVASGGVVMKILDAQFIKSATCRAEWPPGNGKLELALCGRSNVGKSSLLNTLLGRRGLARVSRTPGRTRLLNFFSVDCMREPAAPGEG